MEKPTFLWHGSQSKLSNGDYLQPNISFHYRPLVYATNNLAYAIIRSGKFNIEDFAIKEDYIDGKYVLVELRENAFQDIFDTKGFLYKVNKEDFIEHLGEFISDEPVKIQASIYLYNVWNIINSSYYIDNYCFVKYEDSDNYFKDNNIDKEAYLQRRKARIEKIKGIL